MQNGIMPVSETAPHNRRTMKKLVETILLGAVIVTALAVILALLSFFASISAGGAETFTKAASGLFAFSRVGLIVALLLAAIYAGVWVDWSGGNVEQAAVKPPAPKPEGGEDFTD